MKILVIDDSGVMRRIHINLLQEQKIDDAEILETEDGQRALELAQTRHIDLFHEYLGLKVTSGKPFIRDDPQKLEEVSGIIGLAGCHDSL